MRNTLVILCLTSILNACAAITPGKPSQFYVLQPDQSTPSVNEVQSNNSIAIGLGPITLPVLYDRPQIVTYGDGNRVKLSEYHRWGGNLDADLQRVLMQNLMTQLQSDNVLLYPWSVDQHIDLQVSVQLLRLGGQLGKSAQVKGVLRAFDGKKECQLAVEQFDFSEDTGNTGYDAYINALSRGLSRLSQRIAGMARKRMPGC